MADRLRKIWEVRIASAADADGKTAICSLPERGRYLIEDPSNGGPRVMKKALKLALEDGILQPIIAGTEWINPPWTSHERGGK